ncbi:IS630 transposase-related protein [Methanosphaera sp.]|jgi:hypothetical protein|uniref:IS630 transposase-related protein n=1 Tax=Methanosphaera sp. TaxID=2666342 RepID=UPI003D8E255C
MARNTELMAFEDYYLQTKMGHKSNEAVTFVADKYDVTKRTVFRWKKDYNWDKLATERSIKANEQLAEDIKHESDAAVKDFRKPFISILNRLIAQCVHENEVRITNVKDLVMVMETISKLQKELDIGRTQIVSSEYDRTKHMNEINSLLGQLNKESEHDLELEQQLEEETRENEGGLHQTEVFGDG